MSAVKKRYSIRKTDRESLRRWYYLLYLGRLLDEKAPSYLLQSIGWQFHASNAGHDGIQLAIGQTFQRGKDHLFLYYRDLTSALSAGMTVEEMILNGISKATDPTSGGRHMSDHYAKVEWGIHNISSCVAAHDSQAVGLARALDYYGVDGCAIASHGESSASEGYVFEAINGAARERLPVIFVLQSNGYGISVPTYEQTANPRVGQNYAGIRHLKVLFCNGKDVFDSMNTMAAAREYAVEHRTPVVVTASCVRIGAHSNSDKHTLYRDQDELDRAKAADPLPKFRRMLLRYERFTEEELQQIEAEAREELKIANRNALKAPDPTSDTVMDYVIGEAYPGDKYGSGIPDGSGEELTLVQALNKTLKQEFRHNPDTFIWGQDVANKDKGGVFNVTKGMLQEFGHKRVFNAPIAEDYIVGTANGMSRFDDKIRVVIEGAEFADYFWPAMEQFVNCTHEYWRSNGQFSPNITIRLASGGYIQGGLYHSQNIEAVLTTFPGARVVYPCFADDAAGLLRTAMRSRGVTVFMEPKGQYNNTEAAAVIPEDFEVPFGKARIRREGSDITLVTYGNTLLLSLHVAEQIQRDLGKSIEVIDLRSLAPWDEETVYASIKKTSKVLIVHEDRVFGGFGAELAASIAKKAFRDLDAPVYRVGSLGTPVGFHKCFELTTLPSEEKIYAAAKELIEY